MKNVFNITNWIAVICASTLLLQEANAQVVKLQGAVTMERLVTTQKQAIEALAGVKIEIVGNGAGRGLANLCGGLADIALMAGPLKGVAEAMNAEKPGTIEINGLKEIPISKVKIAFITHPSAGVKSLTEAQARDVLTGKATNWKEVGGADLPIKVVFAFAGDGARITVQEELLKGGTFAKTGILRNSAKDISVVVAQLPGACATLSAKNSDGNVTTVILDKEIEMPLGLVVKGDTAGDIKKVADAIASVIH